MSASPAQMARRRSVESVMNNVVLKKNKSVHVVHYLCYSCYTSCYTFISCAIYSFPVPPTVFICLVKNK